MFDANLALFPQVTNYFWVPVDIPRCPQATPRQVGRIRPLGARRQFTSAGAHLGVGARLNMAIPIGGPEVW